MWDMEGKIDYSSHYTLTFKGDGALNEDGLTNQYISINNDIINAGVVIVDATTLRLALISMKIKLPITGTDTVVLSLRLMQTALPI